jgi:hypothetical protein
MNNSIIFVKLTAFIFLSNCASKHNALTLVDDCLNPIGSQNQLVLAPDRGELGHYHYPTNGIGASEEYRRSGSGSREWVLKNWGAPDEIQSQDGVEYLIYKRRSKDAPNYSMQYLGGERLVKLGYKNRELVYISAYFRNCPPYMKGPVYVLPK